jgi:hypothetical protein
MWSHDRHHDVGAYSLGVLDEVDAFHFEDHLRECPRCAVQVTEFRPAARQLMLYRNATPRAVHPFAGPGPRLLDRLLEEVSARQRAGRRRWLFAVAACVALAVGGPAVAVLAGPGEQPRTVAATDTKTGVWAEVTAEDRVWGSWFGIEVKDGEGPRPCQLVAIGMDGSEETVANWMGAEDDGGEPTDVQGGGTMQRKEISRLEVRGPDGEPLVTLDAPWH